ncbi:MAG: redoxin domain-containing protein [Chloroflexi bacterium]|nr:redoxin domain-containing protein [Chloroflexota bacterium]
MAEFFGKVNAPEFPEGLEWLNTSRPLSIKELRGKIVVLDFWTFCCINCMHIIPDLKKLEKKYAQELVVIGVHSAKFTTEQETENIRQAILRYEVEHPVVNDPDMAVWRTYGAMAWPTLFLIDPAGKIVGKLAGEGVFEPFDTAISRLIAEFEPRGLLDRRPLRLDLERDRAPESLLSFPGKVLADAASERLLISDSNHNRIVVASLADGTVLEVVGRGEIGLEDGGFEEATFNHPQGLVLDGDILYVADTENHALRRLDFGSRQVTTIAGTGEQAAQESRGGVGKSSQLNSPWDLAMVGEKLYIAMAGPHQLWVMDLKSDEVGPYAGSGREARIDGRLEQAALAQPSGIATDGQRLYFADSESSSIRSAELPPRLEVKTIVGLDLFVFGDRDGKGSEVRLQHPLGIAYANGLLYVADTYNNKIKTIDPATGITKTLFGTGEVGMRDGKQATFNEPGGLSLANDRVYIADTNNHLIRVGDLQSREVSSFEFKDMEKLRKWIVPRPATAPTMELAPQTVATGQARLSIGLELPEGHKLTEGAPSKVVLAVENEHIQLPGGESSLVVDMPQFPLHIPLQLEEGGGKITAEMIIYYCQSGEEALCYFKEARLSLPVQIQNGAGGKELEISYAVMPN